MPSRATTARAPSPLFAPRPRSFLRAARPWLLCLALVCAAPSGGCASKRAVILGVLGAAAIGAGSAGVATVGATNLPVGPLSVLGIVLGSVGVLFGALEGLRFTGGH